MITRTALFILLLASTFNLHAAEVQDAPLAIWVSSPVQPGETVLIHGGNFSSNTVVELKCGWKSEVLTPISISDTALMFVYPESWKQGIVTGTIKSGELTSAPFQINAPAVWWIQGDCGRDASTISGSLSLFGNCLADPAVRTPKVTLQSIDGNKRGRSMALKVSQCNAFAIQTANWDAIPAGLYEVTLVRDRKSPPISAGTIRISEKISIIPDTVFDIVEFGAIPNDGVDDTAAILAAIEKLRENCGGILSVPRGRFQMTRTIELPPYSALRGAGADFSQIYWPDSFEPLEALIKGTHSFEVSEIFLTCGNHKDGIVGNWPQPRKPLSEEEKATYKCGNITIRNVTLRMLYSQYINNDLDELKRRIYPIHYARALRLGGENINVTGNDIYCAAGGVFEFRAHWSNISGNTFSRGNIIGWNGYSGQQLIFADNHLGGANCTSFYGLPEGSENIYWGNNYHENNFDGNNRETITGDGRVHAYMDKVENITPTSFTLKGKPEWKYGIDAWKNCAVQIAGGRGVGQIRRVNSISDTKIELESPWSIVPDETSVINISSFRRRFIYTENKAYDSTIALQLYGSMIEGILANNETSRTGGYNGDAMSGEANWFNQFFNNTIHCGNSYRGPRNQVPPLDAQIGLLAYGSGTGDHKYPLVRSCIVRNNTLKSSAHLNVMGWVVDSLLENNTIENADTGVTIDDAARNIVLRNNVFHNVDRPFLYNPDSVIISLAEELQAAMNGVASLMGWNSPAGMPAGWQSILADKKLLQATPEEVAALWEKAVGAFAGQNAGSAVSEKIVETLLGISIQTPNWRTAYPVTQGSRAASAPLMIRIPLSRVKATLKLSFQPSEFPLEGWSLTIPELNLEPGRLVDVNATITRPEGPIRFPKFPLLGELTGDGWKLNFTTSLSDPWEALAIDGFKVSSPFDNPMGKQSQLGYVQYNQLPKVAADQLVDAPTRNGRFDFESFFSEPQNEGKVIYGAAMLKIRNPVKVRFEFSRNCLLFVNGKIVGTTLGRGQWGFVSLQEGENKVEVLMLPAKRDEWKFGIPRIKWAEEIMVFE